MAIDTIVTNAIANDAVTAAKIPAGAVVADIADGSITTAKLADDAVTSAKLGASAVDATALASNAVTTAKIANNAVTAAKATGVGNVEVISQSDTFTSGLSNVDFTLSTDDKYRYQELVITGMFQAANATADTYCRFKVSGTVQSGSGNYKWNVRERVHSQADGGTGNESENAMRIIWYAMGNADGEAQDWVFRFYNTNNSLTHARVRGEFNGSIHNSQVTHGDFSGQFNLSSEVDGFRLFTPGQTMSYRSYTLYGVLRS